MTGIIEKGHLEIKKGDWSSFKYEKNATDDSGEDIDKLISIPGVYLITQGTKGDRTARYVGRGKSIKVRIDDHSNGIDSPDKLVSLMKQPGKNNVAVYYVKVKRKEDQKNVEFTVFDYYGGKEKLYNKKIPPHNKKVSVEMPDGVHEEES